MNSKDLIEAVVDGADPRESLDSLTDVAISPQIVKPLKELGIEYKLLHNEKDFRVFSLQFLDTPTQNQELIKRLKAAGYKKSLSGFFKVIGKDSVLFNVGTHYKKSSVMISKPGKSKPGVKLKTRGLQQ